MSTWARRLGQGYADVGSGVQLPPLLPPKVIAANYSNFRNGLLVADRPADVPAGYYSYAIDVETSRRDGVIRAPGVVLAEDTGHPLEWLGVHTSLDFQSTLIAFDAPFIGVREGTIFYWYNVGLSIGSFWVTSRYGDVLLFSNGVNSYSRNYDTGVVALIPDMPAGATIFTAFGRVFVGGAVQGGEVNLMGVLWNGLSGDYSDWLGDGSGAELLIADVEQSDKIVAGRVISYNIVAVLCRRSIWIGARTGDPFRPADFQFRLLGVGCVAEPTAKTTEGGVTFLSDEGVRHFDGNNAEIISSAINAELLPIDFANIRKYKSAWDGSRRRYILTTPTATYVYQFKTAEYPTGAWFKRSIAPTNVIVLGRQTADPSWDDFLENTWDDLAEVTWFQLATPESNSAPDVLFVSGSRYGLQDSTVTDNFGVTMVPVFQPRPDQVAVVDMADRVILTQSFLIEYIGSGTLDILAMDDQGIVSLVTSVVFVPKTTSFSTRVDVLFSSKAVGIYGRISAGFPEILKIKQLLIDNGPAITDETGDELLDEAALDLTTEANNGVILWQ